MNSRHPLSIVFILLTSPAWAQLGAQSHPGVGLTVYSLNRPHIGYSLGQDQASIGETVVESKPVLTDRPATAKDGDTGKDAYRWLCLLTAQLHNQIEQAHSTLCLQVGALPMSFGVLQAACPPHICLP